MNKLAFLQIVAALAVFSSGAYAVAPEVTANFHNDTDIHFFVDVQAVEIIPSSLPKLKTCRVSGTIRDIENTNADVAKFLNTNPPVDIFCPDPGFIPTSHIWGMPAEFLQKAKRLEVWGLASYSSAGPAPYLFRALDARIVAE